MQSPARGAAATAAVIVLLIFIASLQAMPAQEFSSAD